MISIENMDIEAQLAYQCAPVIVGIKVSNLLIINKSHQQIYEQYIIDTELTSLSLYESHDKLFYLLYRKDKLIQYIMDTKVMNFLKEFGYPNSFDEVLITLKHNFSEFYHRENEFPHEIGLFLGYPVDDVKAFINYKGKDCIFSGYWKVYYEPEKAKRIFDEYNKAREAAIQAVLNGYHLLEFINAYNAKNVFA